MRILKAIILFAILLRVLNLGAQSYSWVVAAKVKYVTTGVGAISVWDMEVDRKGNSYPTGALTGVAYAGLDTVQGGGPNSHKSFTAKVSNTGKFIWAKTTYGHKSYGIGVDYKGNSYTAGSLLGGDMFVEKLDTSGNSLWTKDFYCNSPTWDYITDIVTDSIGNSYVTGYFFNTITIGTITLNNGGPYGNVFLAKLNTSGNVIWVKKIGGNSSSLVAQEIVIDKNYNVYLTGNFSGPTDFGGTILTDSTTSDVYVAKYDSAGVLLYVSSVLKYTSLGNPSVNSVGITVDKKGSVYITGFFNGKLTYGSTTVQNAGISASDNDIFVAKINSFGKTIWAKKAGTTDNDQGWTVAVDECYNVWVAGQIQGCSGCQAIFDTQTYPSPSATINHFVAKYSNSGVIQNVKTSTSNVHEQIISMKSMPNGNIKHTGIFGLVGSSVKDTVEFDTQDYISQTDTNYLYVAQINNCNSNYNDLSYNIPNPLCEGVQVNFASGNPNTSWSNGSNGQNISITNVPFIWADITTCNNCIKRDSVHLNFQNLPVANFTFNVTSYSVALTNNSNYSTSYLWDFGDSQTSSLVNPVHTYSSTGTYTIILTASNICGSSTYSIVISISAPGIKEIEKENISVYPTILEKGIIKITGNNLSNKDFKLNNLMGETIQEGKISDINEIEIYYIENAGIYQLIIEQESKVYCVKLIIIK